MCTKAGVGDGGDAATSFLYGEFPGPAAGVDGDFSFGEAFADGSVELTVVAATDEGYGEFVFVSEEFHVEWSVECKVVHAEY